MKEIQINLEFLVEDDKIDILKNKLEEFTSDLVNIGVIKDYNPTDETIWDHIPEVSKFTK